MCLRNLKSQVINTVVNQLLSTWAKNSHKFNRNAKII